MCFSKRRDRPLQNARKNRRGGDVNRCVGLISGSNEALPIFSSPKICLSGVHEKNEQRGHFVVYLFFTRRAPNFSFVAANLHLLILQLDGLIRICIHSPRMSAKTSRRQANDSSPWYIGVVVCMLLGRKLCAGQKPTKTNITILKPPPCSEQVCENSGELSGTSGTNKKQVCSEYNSGKRDQIFCAEPAQLFLSDQPASGILELRE